MKQNLFEGGEHERPWFIWCGMWENGESSPNSGWPTVFIQLNATAFFTFFMTWVRRLYEGGIYQKSNLFFANNIVWQMNT